MKTPLKRQFLLTSTAVIGLTVAHSQIVSLNQLDSGGKKDGKWIVYLDAQWKEFKDSSHAVYYRYNYFDHGIDIYRMQRLGIKTNWKLESSTNSSQKIKLLDGDYKWVDNKGQIRSIHKFNKGECVLNKYFHSTGKTDVYYDYTKKWNGLTHTYLCSLYDKNGDVKYYYVQKINGAWGAYWANSDSITIDTLKANGDSTFVTSKHYLKGKLICQKGQIFVLKSNEQLGQFTRIMYHGRHTDWYANGQKQFEGENHYGKKIGEWKYWDKSGNEYIPEKDFQ